MNLKPKYFIVSFFSLILLFAPLYLPERADSAEAMKKIGFGYPLKFISQDFSEYNQGFQFFPRWQRFEIKREIAEFSFIKLAVDFAVIFLALEIIIYALESLDFWARKKFFD